MPETPEKIIYLYYYEDIESSKIRNLMSLITKTIAEEKPDVLYFLISSGGGEVDAGVTFYNFLKSLPVKIVMHNIGSIDSIANVIFVAGTERYATPHATFLFHGVQQPVNGPTSLSLPQMNEIVDRVHKNHNTIAGIVCDNSDIEEEEIKALFRAGETKDVQFALEKGIIHEVKTTQIPEDAPFITINSNA